MKTMNLRKLVSGIILFFVMIVMTSDLSRAAANPAERIYVQLGDITGPSTDKQHSGWIEALSFTMGVSNSGSSGTTGAGAGKAVFAPFTIVKSYDIASPQIALDVAEGKVFEQVVAEVDEVAAGGHELPFVKVTLKNALISSVQSTISGGASPGLNEVVSIMYEQICWEYTPILANGSSGTPVVECETPATSN